MSYKTKRIASNMLRSISKILNEEVRNELLKNVSITDITVDSDLTFAKVYFMTHLDNHEDVEIELNRASRFIRGELAKSLNMRSTPELKFVYDKSLDVGNRIESILNKVKDAN